jgi:hypothetical protein
LGPERLNEQLLTERNDTGIHTNHGSRNHSDILRSREVAGGEAVRSFRDNRCSGELFGELGGQLLRRGSQPLIIFTLLTFSSGTSSIPPSPMSLDRWSSYCPTAFFKRLKTRCDDRLDLQFRRDRHMGADEAPHSDSTMVIVGVDLNHRSPGYEPGGMDLATLPRFRHNTI